MSQQDTLCRLMCPTCGRIFLQGDKLTCPDDGAELGPIRSDAMIGQIIDGKYKILDVVGAGGMSLVFKAEHLLLNRFVAVKMLHSYLRRDDVSVRRFQQEARACASFDHPNVVPILDFGVARSGQPYLVMKFLDGVSLTHILRDRHRLDWKEAVKIFVQVCSALDAAHRIGIIHRDVKPGNIVLTREPDGSDRVRVVDFGIAKMLKDDSSTNQKLTMAGEVFGSPLYMSPEQCEGLATDARSDMYSLGAVMFETLCGEPPLLGRSATETMQLHMKQRAPSFSSVAPDLQVPEELEHVVDKLLAKAPTDRYSSMAEVRLELEKIAASAVAGPVPVARKSTLFGHPLAGLVIFSLLAVLWVFQGVPQVRLYRLEHMVARSERLVGLGDTVKAIETLENALKISRQQNDHGAWQSRILALLSSAHEQAGQFEQAEQCDRQREQLIRKEMREQYGATNADLEKMADAAVVAAAEPVQVKRKGIEFYNQRVKQLENASVLCLTNNDVPRAEKLAQRAVQLHTQVFGESSPSLYALERQLGKVCLRTQDFARANDCFSKSMREAQQTNSSTFKVAVITYARIGEALARRGIYAASERYYTRSLDLAERRLPANDPCVPSIMRSFASVLKADRKEEQSNRLLAAAQAREQRGGTCDARATK
ncbi:MAG: serine/threonine-protein kinase [Candidatus Obscuribacterales bacterium]|nr:serine/threonine-protein kinase [Candidatus Obscuribacterales bacterium]